MSPCEHPNECPVSCPCSPGCICQAKGKWCHRPCQWCGGRGWYDNLSDPMSVDQCYCTCEAGKALYAKEQPEIKPIKPKPQKKPGPKTFHDLLMEDDD